MEMVVMRRIVIGRQDRREQAAAAVPDLVEKAALLALVAPVGGDADAAAILEPEAGDIDRVGAGMLAPQAVRAAVHAPAAIASEMVDCDDPAAEAGERGRL